MPQTAEKIIFDDLRFTYEDYLQLPDDGKRYEIIEGELVMSPAPKLSHQALLRNLVKYLLSFIEENKSGTLFFAPCDVVFSDLSIVQPDILFISNENRSIMKESNIQGTPDLIIEVTSPSTEDRDLGYKKRLYAKYGVREYWIVDPNREKIEVWNWESNRYVLSGFYEKSESAKSLLLSGFEVELEKVFRI